MSLIFPGVLKSMERHKQPHSVGTQKIRYNIIQQSRLTSRNFLEWIEVLWGELVKYHRSIKMLKHEDSRKEVKRGRDWERGGKSGASFSNRSWFLCRFFHHRSLFVLYFKRLTPNNIKRMMSSYCLSKPKRKEGKKNRRSSTINHLLKSRIFVWCVFIRKNPVGMECAVISNLLNFDNFFYEYTFFHAEAQWIWPMGKLWNSTIKNFKQYVRY